MTELERSEPLSSLSIPSAPSMILVRTNRVNEMCTVKQSTCAGPIADLQTVLYADLQARLGGPGNAAATHLTCHSCVMHLRRAPGRLHRRGHYSPRWSSKTFLAGACASKRSQLIIQEFPRTRLSRETAAARVYVCVCGFNPPCILRVVGSETISPVSLIVPIMFRF